MRGRKRRNDIDSSEFDNVVSLYKNKISLKQIAFDYDVTAYVVRDVLVGMGVKIGPRGRPWKKGKVIETDLFTKVIKPEILNKNRYQDKPCVGLENHTDEMIENDLFDLGDFRRPLGE